MQNKPLISVTIPAFKSKYLGEAITSVLSQTYANYELIIVNDASPEDLTSIIDNFKDSRIHYYINETGFGGYDLVGNWNRCLDYCEGEYMICMGDDDKLLPTCLEDYVKLINKYPQKGVYHVRSQIIDENSVVKRNCEVRPEEESVYHLVWTEISQQNNDHIGDFLFDVKMLKDKGGFYKLPWAWHSDHISVFSAAERSGMASSNSFGFQYRESSITISNSSTHAEDKVEATLQAKQYYKNLMAEEPKSDVDRKFWFKIKERIDDYIRLYIYCDINNDLKKNRKKLFRWLMMSKKYDVKKSIILYNWLMLFK